ncbi:MAG: UDP-N-acetylmuramate--L-alanine ligase [Patescibacteria group bacterium]|jgi:UDP-N-acetylmuramate--alanine ligase
MKYHLIGDQGVSMRGLAKYLSHLGHTVSGSDLKTGGHSAANVPFGADVVVRTSAVSPGSPGWVEVDQAEKQGAKVIKRSKLIGQLTENKRLIAISGMHGKTTVTSMAGLVLEAAGFDPTVLVGDQVLDFNNDVIRIGQSDWFVLEACEYDRSFLDFHPEILILTNIEEEHLDTYPGGLPEIKKAFSTYLENVSPKGTIIACKDDDNVREVIEQSETKAKVIWYGNHTEYDKLDFQLSVPGVHNSLNALAVKALADCLGIDGKIVATALSKFQGAHRRFELLGNFQGADLIDDYGHHPTEIKATLAALKERYHDKKRIVVFWPHQYKRILPLLDEFAASFHDADLTILKPIFFVPGRDEELPVSSQDLVKKINDRGDRAKFIETDQEIAEFLTKELDKDSVLLTIGIPPVYKISEILLGGKND